MVPERLRILFQPRNQMDMRLFTLQLWSGIQMELQIRSSEMHKIAEYGVASHWIYKKLGNKYSKKEIKESNRWFQDVIEIIKTAGGPRELWSIQE